MTFVSKAYYKLTTLVYRYQGFPSGYAQQEQDLGKLKARLDIDREVAQRVPVSDDYWYETYGVPKPDNYDELKREQQERRDAALRSMQQHANDEPNDDEPKPRKAKKDKTVKERLADFFA